MKAIIYHRYGGPEVLQLQEVDMPALAASSVLVRVHAASANPYDWHFLRGEPYFMRLMFGLRAPKRHGLGVDFAGEVEKVGSAVADFHPGAQVYGMCDGAFAEYVACPASALAIKPANLTYEQAAAVPLAGLTALQGLRDAGQLKAGQHVLIVGASGGVGTFAVQIAKALGAHVTGVCSTRNVELVRALGADAVIDYTQEDFTRGVQRYDVIFQLGGVQSPAACRRALTPKGILVLSSGDSNGRVIGPLDRIIQASVLSRFVSQTLAVLDVKRSRADLESLAGMIDAGTLRPIVERTLPLAEVSAAIRHVETGHVRGKVVITLLGMNGV
jgi:NADPH:quinone reductase-like Zn-dependent oxidoreductase